MFAKLPKVKIYYTIRIDVRNLSGKNPTKSLKVAGCDTKVDSAFG